ncbi:MAG: glycosyltransferase family 39 protein [Patescibacteria group bacterium]|nr:glycosyltransferase family 39 protein [Patescibacteria group bacterium]
MERISLHRLLFVCLFVILLIGAYLRLYKIQDYLTFLGDEGRDVLIVKRMIIDGDLILLGPTASVGGFFLGPMYYYFMAPFLWLWNLNPVGPAVMVALFGIATIYLVFRVGKEFFHPVVGLISSSLYAVSPVVIAYSRSSWNPNLVPFFSLLLIYMLWRFAMYKKLREVFFAGLIAGMGIQFHYLYSILIVYALIWLIILSSRHVIKATGLFFLGFFLTFSPFVAFELRHSFPNTRALINFFLAGEETSFVANKFFSIVGDVSFRSFGRLLYRMPNYELWNGFSDFYIQALIVIIKTTLYVSLGLLIFFVIQYIKAIHKKNSLILHEQGIGASILLGWFMFSVLLFGFYQRAIYDYYFGIFFAFPFLCIGLILWQIIKNKFGYLLGFILWMILFYYNWQGSPFRYPPNKQLEQTQRIARSALDMTNGRPFNFALITATNSDHAYRYFFELWGRKPVTIEQPAVDPERKTVTDQLIVICENPSCQPLGHSSWEVAGFGRAEIIEEKEVFPVKIFRLIHYKGDS